MNDTFDSGGIPSHWDLYQASWASVGHTPTAYYSPSHCFVAGGYLNMLMKYEPNGIDGNPAAAWYTCTAALTSGIESSPVGDARVTLRWREVPQNGGRSHHNMPLRWPNSNCWPRDGEEDWFEGESATYNFAQSFMHYGTDCAGGGHVQQYHNYPTVDLTQFHTFRFQRVTTGSNVEVAAYIDDMSNPVWACNQTTSPACTATTMTTVMKHTVLQQEVPWNACPDQQDPEFIPTTSWTGTCPTTTNPSYLDGTVDYQVDWITVDNPS